MKTLLLIAILLPACDFYYPFDQDTPLAPDPWREVPNPADTDAVVAELQAFYGFSAHEPPVVYTYGGAGLDCPHNPTAWYAPQAGECIDGLYRGGVIAVSDGRGDDRLRRGVLAHEVYHYYLRAVTGDKDPGHIGAGWRAGGVVNLAADAVDGEYRDPPR